MPCLIGLRLPWRRILPSVIEPSDPSEQRFIQRLQERDERAFLELVQLYQARVYKLVFRMLGRREEAEDVAQEVFVQVFKAVGTFRGDSRLSTWIYRISANLCKNRLKYLLRRKVEAREEEEPGLATGSQTGALGVTAADLSRPDQLLEGYQLQEIVRDCMAEMDADFREILILRDIEDLSYEELSEVTGLADGTVKSRLHRARALLKLAVERRLGERIG